MKRYRVMAACAAILCMCTLPLVAARAQDHSREKKLEKWKERQADQNHIQWEEMRKGQENAGRRMKEEEQKRQKEEKDKAEQEKRDRNKEDATKQEQRIKERDRADLEEKRVKDRQDRVDRQDRQERESSRRTMREEVERERRHQADIRKERAVRERERGR